MNVGLEGVYPIEDPKDLPIKTVDLGRAKIFVKGNIENKHIFGLADVKVEEDEPLVHIKFSVWEDSGAAKSLDRQLLMGGKTLATELEGKRVYIFDPYEINLWEISEDMLPQLVETDGYFWQVARFFGADRISDKYLLGQPSEELQLQIVFKGFQRFEEAKKFQFGLNNEADLYVGDLEFDVTISAQH